MDELDSKIIEVLKDDCRTSPTKIARKLKVSRKTVYNRISRLNEDKVIWKYTILLSGNAGVEVRAAFIHPLKYLSSRTLEEDLKKLGAEVSKSLDVLFAARVGDRILLVWQRDKFNPKTVAGAGRVEELNVSEVYKFG